MWSEFDCASFQAKDNSAAGGPSASTSAAGSEVPVNDDIEYDDDDDELDFDELNELEASLSRTSIQIREPGIEASWRGAERVTLTICLSGVERDYNEKCEWK